MSDLHDLIRSRWPVTDRDSAGRACAELALTLTRLGAGPSDRARTVAALWDRLQERRPATVSFRLTPADVTDVTEFTDAAAAVDRVGELAVDDEMVTELRLPAARPDPSDHEPRPGAPELLPSLLDIV